MSKRLLNLRQIQAEKIARSRTWIYTRMTAGEFPAPLPGAVPNLWEEEAVDAWLAQFIERSKAASGARKSAQSLGRGLTEARRAKRVAAKASANPAAPERSS